MTTTELDDVTADDDRVSGTGTIGSGRGFALLLVITGALGILASWIITLDKIELLKNPNHKPACTFNPIISCTNVMQSKQADVFGFPNPMAGLVGFGVVVAIGMALLAGARFRRWYWAGLNIGTGLAAVFCMWLMVQSLYHINSLCLWCTLTWCVTILMFWYTTVHNLKHGIIPAPAGLRRVVLEFHWVLPVLWYGVIALLILTRWWTSFWSTLL
ncbi:vitamin K epoxide reductase family protein [Streptomyces nigrescens]|uniref:Membrane protein n=1 Tax=Streptomyces nigrescens TaxID=1920 RepID=A0A640TEA4_STRNI|nr:vitamin K epoxide reductase family protein [Streptomyces libani]WAT95394.1 vitamin K epoxide reductase family protein [Streptomyces libani subsp. libani]GFE20606.1 membrane protein [Streptomyces libani subsp. libani]GGV87594.1 membrane protein [Streptomyces libani subsp. libani]